MRGIIDRENQIFDILHAFNDRGVAYTVVGGYAVSAFEHRFSVDADLVVRADDVDDFVEILADHGFDEVADRELDAYGGRYLAYEKREELPVTIDLLVNGLHCRQTDASWSHAYFERFSMTADIEGSERAVTVRIPEKELLVAAKLHSGRLTDVRDAVALTPDLDFDQVENHLNRGDPEKLNRALQNVIETISSDGFEDAFKGVFQQGTLPEDDIRALHHFLQEQVNG